MTALTLQVDYEDEMGMESQLSRWGSRSFNKIYTVCSKDASFGLDGAVSVVEEGCMCVCQEMHGRSFCIAVKPVSECLAEMKREGAHVVKAVFSTAKHMEQLFYITAAVGEDPESAKELALKQIQSAEEIGVETLYQEHAKDWDAFWNRSYISLPEKQDFLENIWYLNLYYSNCQMRGEYPASAMGGIWNWYHDYLAWGTPLHWNQQSSLFPLDAANHPELMTTYFRFCRNMLPQAERFARDVKKKKGALFVDITDIKGRFEHHPFNNVRDNCSPGAYIALEMYQYYRFTGDEKFLEETLMPVMRGAAEYYLDELELGEDGYYHIYGTSAYEDPFFVMDDTITDMAAIRALFSALIPFLPEDEAVAYKKCLEKLAPFHTAEFCEEEVDADGVVQLGLGRGRKVLDDKLLAAGLRPRLPKVPPVGCTEESLPDYAQDTIKEFGREKTRRTYSDPKRLVYGHPDQELMTVYPTGLTGIQDKGSDLYNWAVNCIYIHQYEDSCGWIRTPLFLARMGMADLLEEKLEKFTSNQIIFPQGIGTDAGPGDGGFMGFGTYSNRWGKYSVRLQWMGTPDGKETFDGYTSVPSWNFRYFNFESAPIISAAVNEMLLQSYNGTIRLFPAIEKERQTAFRLAAIDGRMVEAVFDNGECDVLITCDRGGQLSVTADHVNSGLTFADADTGMVLVPAEENGIYTLKTEDGQRISVRTQNAGDLSIERDYSKNMDVKHFGKAKLGTEREFTGV